MKKRILCAFVAAAMLLTQISFAQEITTAAEEPTQDENGYYQIGTAEELFWFADFAEKTANQDAETAEKNNTDIVRTLVKGKLTANISLNPDMSVSYNDETGKVTLSNGEKSYKMGTGLKGTSIGQFEASNGDTVSSEAVEEALGIVKWTPIGTNSLPFVGYFDGNGYTVDGLYINEHTVRGNDTYLYNGVGFFGNTNTNATTENYQVKDYKIQNFSIGQNSLVVGYDENSSSGTSSKQAVGAIVGNSARDSLYKCENNAIVVGMGSTSYAAPSCTGGLVGKAGGAIDECINKGTVISPNAAGGIVGWKWTYSQTNYSYEAYSKIYKCINYGKVLADVTKDGSLAGGITGGAGYNANSQGLYEGGYIEGCCNKGDVEGYMSAGIATRVSYYTYIYRCSNFGNISAPYIAGGIVGLIQHSLAGAYVDLCYNAGTINRITDVSDVSDTYIYPLVGLSTYPDSRYSSLVNSYNNNDICPVEDNALAPTNVMQSDYTTGCYSVSTAAFKSGEVAYRMETENSPSLTIRTTEWTQNLEYPREDGKILDDYPTVWGHEEVYKVNYHCCHNSETDEYTEHTKEIYANSNSDITDTCNFDETKICTHCGNYCGAPEFLSEDTRLKNGKVGSNYFVTVHLSERSTNNGPNYGNPEYEILSSTLPKGLYADGYGNSLNIDGMPKEAGTFTFTVKVTNNYGSTEKTFTLSVMKADELVIYTEKPENATVGEKYWANFSSNHSSATWSIADGSKLPDGLEIVYDYAISGTPTEAGTYTFTIQAEAYGQTATKVVTLIVEPEGGCTHESKALIDEVEPTCEENGTLAHWYCKDCDCRFEDADCKEKIYNFPQNIATVSDHLDSDSDGKCDFCNKPMPLFMQIKSKSLITSEGTYAFISKIGDKYYALALPTEGTEYTDKTTMPVCEVEPNEDGAFTFNELKNKNAIMAKTGFCAADGNLDAGEPRYSLSTIIGKSAYGLNGDYGSSKTPIFNLDTYSDSKYGWHLSIDNNYNTTISSVYHEVWGEDNTKEMLKAYIGEDAHYMSLYDTTENTPYDVQLYKMITLGNTNDVNYIITDNQGNFISNDTAFTVAVDNAGLSNVSGLSNAIKEECIEKAINDYASDSKSVVVESYVAIDLNEAELLYDTSYDTIKFSLTPHIKITDGSGNVIKDLEISDESLNGNKMTVTLSVGGSETPEQIIHYKNDGTKEYFYSEHSEKAVYEGEKSFKFTWGDKGNFVTFEITSFSDIEILSSTKIEDDEVDEGDVTNAISYKDNALKISVEKAGTYSVIFANYDDNRLTGIRELSADLNEGINDVKLPEDVKLSAGDKILLWNSFSGMIPLCEGKTVE